MPQATQRPFAVQTPVASAATALAARVRRVEIKTRRLVNDMMVGAYHSQFKGRGMDFEELREYIPGDDVRSIDWNVTARMRRNPCRGL